MNNVLKKFTNLLKKSCEIANLPRIKFVFDKNLMSIVEVKDTYEYFNKKHPRLRFVKNKQIGVAYINLNRFARGIDYLLSVNGKNSAYYYSRKCQRRGYLLEEIDRNKLASQIAWIERSAPTRQGRPMSCDYGDPNRIYEDLNFYKYFGVRREDKLVAYCNVGIYGNFACISRLLGHVDYLNDGIMYFMLTEIISNLIDENKKVSYIFYDTWYGASFGLRQFKEKLGFSPCVARWALGDLS